MAAVCEDDFVCVTGGVPLLVRVREPVIEGVPELDKTPTVEGVAVGDVEGGAATQGQNR